MTDVPAVPATVAVATQSAFLSKINWTQAVGITATVLALITANKVQIPAEQQVAIVTVIQGIQGVATWIIKTWFTKTVTPASVAQATTTTLPQQTLVHLS